MTEEIEMDHKEIFDAAKSNNIRKLLQAKKEIHQIHTARNISETMYLNDVSELERIICQARQMIDSLLEEVRIIRAPEERPMCFLEGMIYVCQAIGEIAPC